MAIAVHAHYEAAHEQATLGNRSTAAALQANAEAFEATRDYLIANRLTPQEREAFTAMLDEKLAAAADRLRGASFWSQTAGKATVAGVGIAGLVGVTDLVIQLFHLVHP